MTQFVNTVSYSHGAPMHNESLPDGYYYLHVNATDVVHFASSVVSASTVTIDGTPPVFGPAVDDHANDGVEVDLSNVQGLACVSFSVVDDISGLGSITASLVSRTPASPPVTSVVATYPVSVTSTHFCVPNTTVLVSGHTYWLEVKAFSACTGLFST